MDFRLVILKVFTRKHQLSLQADAMTLLQQILTDHEITNTEDAIQSLEILAKEYLLQDDCSTIVTKPLLQRVYETVVEKSTAAVTDGSQSSEIWDPDHHLYFIDAFEMPRWHYSLERKAFEKAIQKPNIAGSAESKAMFLRDRYNIIKQIILRNENFSPPAFAGKDRANYLKLTSTKNLLGRAGGRFLLFGMLTRSPEGRLCLEDLDGIVPLNISNTVKSIRLYQTGWLIIAAGPQ
ncbi:DNA-directed DNA polymerase epsilon, subunit B [Serendipita sp. 396]|nr:DNA-directed DNA polymerase epsilon, subunit B [Serendipita sp. 396]KAG8788736.1 DNA-directed DNA polymerase epsilon, subunit B [Serendipita sp. 397]KAG8803756.1 DNA-directed DNA polymerase epsilon, subunit B [Serendipita sp. 398]